MVSRLPVKGNAEATVPRVAIICVFAFIAVTYPVWIHRVLPALLPGGQ